MSSVESSPVWPPKGWAQLAKIKSCNGQSVSKDIARTRIIGLQYKIDTVPLFKGCTKFLNHHISIDGWEYSILNESIEYPVLSFSLMDRFDDTMPAEYFITDIRAYATPVPHTKRSAMRAVTTAIFLMDQIGLGQVPAVDHVLKSNRLHPAQIALYRSEQALDISLQKAFDREVKRQGVRA
jgi:hypothetical protein